MLGTCCNLASPASLASAAGQFAAARRAWGGWARPLRNLFCGPTVPTGWQGGGESLLALASGVPPLAKGCFSESAGTLFGLLALRHLVDLGKLSGAGAAVEFINRFLGEILPSGNVDRLEPALLSPAPRRAWRHPHLLQPSGEADYRRAGVGVRLAIRFIFHTQHPAGCAADVGVSQTRTDDLLLGAARTRRCAGEPRPHGRPQSATTLARKPAHQPNARQGHSGHQSRPDCPDAVLHGPGQGREPPVLLTAALNAIEPGGPLWCIRIENPVGRLWQHEIGECCPVRVIEVGHTLDGIRGAHRAYD